MPTALITGITGQDGSYLAELLLEKGYEVHGIIQRSSSVGTLGEHLYSEPQRKGRAINLHYGDMSDSGGLRSLIERTQPDEIYNLAAQSHVQVSFEIPGFLRTSPVWKRYDSGAIRDTGSSARFYQASSSEMFGATSPQSSRRSSTHAVPMPQPRRSPTTARSTTAKRTACSQPAASSSTTKARVADARS